MDMTVYTQYIQRQLSHIEYDSKDASRNAHYQLGLLISIIARAGYNDNKIWNVMEEVLKQNPHRT